ncbi:ABC transporter substrate-binding protein [Cumulibacter soli]|uniref:ABC transporter substrate-binding protein n=1 Tax=Cumulibacter soli TaxID=2546344 RepID=UPI001068BAAE|nr:ABC transporter substrate-binding protein [Cumulibacter soli]
MKQASRLIAATVGGSLLLAGCGEAPEESSASDTEDFGMAIELDENYDPNGHFDWGYTSFASTWDPIKSINGSDQNFYEPVYDRLLFEDVDGVIHPMLAEEFTPSDDGKTLTLKLRENLKFSDGAAFNAEAVKFNLDRARGEESKINGELYQVEDVEIVDEYTVDVHLSGSIGSLPVALANRAGIMVSPEAAKAGLLDTEPVGIGPYVTSEIVPGSNASYEKTPDYWDPDAQRVATMTYYYMVEDQTRINALKSGEVDGARINPDEMDVAADGGATPIVQPSSLFLYFMVSTAIEPFDNPEVRRAINMAIDREAISQGMYDGYCTPQIQPFPESSPGYSEKLGDGLDEFPYDPEAAKQILEEEGITEPIDIATAAPNVTIYTKFAEVIQDQLGEIGINIEIHALPPAEQVQEFAIDKVTETFTSVSTGINDPDVVNSRYVAPDSLFNAGSTEYPDLQKYGIEGASTLDPTERKPAYEKYMDAWVESPPHLIPVCTIHMASAYNSNVSGVGQKANGYPDLRGVAVAKE